MVIHVLGLSRSISSKEFSTCPFTHNAICVSDMLMSKVHEVIHYGAETSEVNCTEHVDVLTIKELEETYTKDFEEQEHLYAIGNRNYAYNMFRTRASHEIRKRANARDMLCFFAGNTQIEISNDLRDVDMIHVEPAVGYDCIFANNRVFASNSWMSFKYGQFHERWEKIPKEDRNDMNKWTPTCNPYGATKWQDDIIPHPVDMSEFEYEDKKEDYLLHISRIVPVKGIELAIRISQHLGIKLKIAGQGNFRNTFGYDPPDHVELLGVVGPKERSDLMKNAMAVFSLSHYVEPFGLTVIEAGACGTPVIATDWGAFRETVKEGYSGYLVRGFKQGIEAVKDIGKIKPENCRKWVQDNFSTDVLADRYDGYFNRLLEHVDAHKAGKGIYYL